MRLSSACVGTILALSWSCSGDKTPPETAFITTDQATIGFDQIFGSGTFIGTMPMASLDIKNEGQGDLHITAYNLSGDISATAGFTVVPLTNPPVTVKGLQDTFLSIVFTPAEPKVYRAQVVIVSDAPNSPDGGLVIGISGLGVRPPSNCNLPDGGLKTPDFADGGCTPPPDAGH